MTLSEQLAAIAQLSLPDALKAQMIQEVLNSFNQTLPAPVAPAPAPDAPVIIEGAGPALIGDVVPSGTPGTVTLKWTGHVLSLPMMDKGEMLMGYMQRVYKQCLGERIRSQGINPLTAVIADFKLPDGSTCHMDTNGAGWPEFADKWYNEKAYDSNYDSNAGAWAAVGTAIGEQNH
jgi:hypothetical protein